MGKFLILRGRSRKISRLIHSQTRIYLKYTQVKLNMFFPLIIISPI